MPKQLCVRALTDDEQVSLRRLAHARAVSQREWRHARIIWLAHQGKEIAMIATEVGVCRATVRRWVKRFNADGIVGLQNAPRSGGQITYLPKRSGKLSRSRSPIRDPSVCRSGPGRSTGSWRTYRWCAASA